MKSLKRIDPLNLVHVLDVIDVNPEEIKHEISNAHVIYHGNFMKQLHGYDCKSLVAVNDEGEFYIVLDNDGYQTIKMSDKQIELLRQEIKRPFSSSDYNIHIVLWNEIDYSSVGDISSFYDECDEPAKEWLKWANANYYCEKCIAGETTIFIEYHRSKRPTEENDWSEGKVRMKVTNLDNGNFAIGKINDESTDIVKIISEAINS